jgi:hypothetical protein
MTAQPKLDLRVDLSELTPHLQVPAGVPVVALGAVHQVLEDLGLLE